VPDAFRQHVPAEVAVVACRGGQGVWIAGEDLVADGRETVAENLADVGMPAGAADDLLDAVAVDVADRELVEVGREAAARLDLAAWIDDQGLAGALAVVFLEPDAVP